MVRREGFTLVELMIVVGIIGILASIAIPGFQKYKDKARMSEVHTALAGLLRGAQAYYVQQNSSSAALTATESTNCSVVSTSGVIPFIPNGTKYAGYDWSSNVATNALGFSMDGPVSFGLYIAGAGTCGATLEAQPYANLFWIFFIKESERKMMRYSLMTRSSGGNLINAGVSEDVYATW